MSTTTSTSDHLIRAPKTHLRNVGAPWRNARVADGANLECLLDYEMRCAARYRRFTSLIMVTAAFDDCNIHQLLSDVMRASDEFFQGTASGAILMGETDGDGALNAVNRFIIASRDTADLRFGIATYPSDAHDALEMLAIAQRRLLSARMSPEFGKVVFSD